MFPYCFDCRFFCPEKTGCLSAGDLKESDWDESLTGECRRHAPQVGRFRGEQEPLQYDYGQWPLVLACNWCGEFQPCDRARATASQKKRTISNYTLVER